MEVPKQVAVILFFNTAGEILLQDRRERSKWGEEYGFFGGKVEEGETPEEAIKRELKEELELENINLELFKRYKHFNRERGVEVDRTVYLAPIPDLEKIKCHEGKPEVRSFKNSFNLKLIPGFDILLKDIFQFLVSQNRIEPQ